MVSLCKEKQQDPSSEKEDAWSSLTLAGPRMRLARADGDRPRHTRLHSRAARVTPDRRILGARGQGHLVKPHV